MVTVMTAQPPDGVRMVRLRADVEVPERTTILVRAQGAKNRPCHCTVDLIIRGGRPYVERMVIVPPVESRPISPEQLADLDLADIVRRAVARLALDAYPAPADEAAEAAAVRDAMDLARSMQRRKVTPELLERVVELHERGGIALVQDELHTTERNARRWLARAKEAGLL